jgi:uncharacterized protein (TIGR02001 family)
MNSKGMKLIFGAAALAALAASSTVAFADDDSPWGSLSAYVAVQSDYRFRGLSQNDKDPSPEASVNWSGPEGFYAGTWLAKVNFQAATGDGLGTSYSDHTSLETDFYAGKHTDLWGTDLNLEAYLYAYPDHNIATNITGSHYHDTYFEMIGQLSHPFGPVSLTATAAYSPNFFGQTGTGWYIEGTAAYTVNDWLSFSANLGHQWVSRVDSLTIPNSYDGEDPFIYSSGLPYTHWDIGATFTYKQFALDVRYVDTNLSSVQCYWTQGAKNLCDATVMATLTYNIPAFPW